MKLNIIFNRDRQFNKIFGLNVASHSQHKRFVLSTSLCIPQTLSLVCFVVVIDVQRGNQTHIM